MMQHDLQTCSSHGTLARDVMSAVRLYHNIQCQIQYMYLCFRSMSVLSGGSLTSQSSRRSAQSLYKWKKKWSQESRNRSDTRSPTPLLSQSKLDQSHNTSLLSQSHTGHLSNLISQTAARSEVNTSLFSDDEDEEEWMQAICSDQVSRCYPIHKSLVHEKFHTFQFCRVK